MPLQIVRNDITEMKVDAIVCPSDQTQECGQKITEARNLPCRYIISVSGPRWYKGNKKAKEKLASCCRDALKLGAEHQCQSMALPLISAGTFGYPKDLVLRTLADTVCEFLTDHEMMIYLVVYDRESYRISRRLFKDISEYIDEHYLSEHGRNTRISEAISEKIQRLSGEDEDVCIQKVTAPVYAKLSCSQTLEDALSQIDESFSEMLLRKIDESGMTDVQCYKKANIDRRLFAKIRSDRLYSPSKRTVLAFAIALELSLDETKDMLMKAGFALSHSSRSDIIVEYFIAHKNYNIFEINEALFAFDQSLLGA